MTVHIPDKAVKQYKVAIFGIMGCCIYSTIPQINEEFKRIKQNT
jgi:hypothetical protein